MSREEFIWEYVPSEVDKEQATRRLVKSDYRDGEYVQYYTACGTVEEDSLKELGRKFMQLTLGTDGDTIVQ